MIRPASVVSGRSTVVPVLKKGALVPSFGIGMTTQAQRIIDANMIARLEDVSTLTRCHAQAFANLSDKSFPLVRDALVRGSDRDNWISAFMGPEFRGQYGAKQAVIALRCYRGNEEGSHFTGFAAALGRSLNPSLADGVTKILNASDWGKALLQEIAKDPV